ncbi:MAG: M20/M25/M40 family metallo-hydrolase [Lachnospiraceae bacterium]|nr:M20/M25/M40 family metallo-hydrolase [Lachnospiraceae bacterium]
MNKYKEQIDAYIDGKKDQMLEDLAALVRINSQKGIASEGKPFGEGPAAVLAAAQKLMEDYGLSVKNYENYVVAGDLFANGPETASGVETDLAAVGETTSQKGLDILAHLDVVPVTEDWTVTQPFEPKIVDGKIYGRGTADDKGPAIAALYALRAIHDLGIPMKKGARLVLGSDEECGSGDLRYYYGIEEEAPYTFTPDADFPVINIEKGRLETDFTAEFSGIACLSGAASAAGGSFDDETSSKADDNADTENDPTSGRFALPRILSLKSGDKANVVPGRAVLMLEGVSEAAARAAADETEKETSVSFTITEETAAAPGENMDVSLKTADSGKTASILKIEARGFSAHASTPQEGHNALTAAIRLAAKLSGSLAPSEGLNALLALDRLFPYEDTCGRALGVYREEEQSGAVTLCLSILDYTPERLKGTFDSRLPIGCTEENTKQPIKERLAENGIHLEDKPMTRPHCVPGDSEFVKILLDSYELYTGERGTPLSTGGGTYVHNLERGVAFGCMTPDVDNHMHGDDEFMVIERLLTSAKIFAEAIIRICNEL